MEQYLHLVDFMLRAFIVPASGIMYRLSNSISELRLSLHRDFVTRAALNERLQLEREITDRD